MTTQTRSSLRFLILAIAFAAITMQSMFLEACGKMPTVTIGKNVIKLEVAQTPKEIEKGLMFRSALDKESGMVFLFHPERPVRFWMYNCLISLDMIFVKDGKIIKICEDVPPCKSEDPSKCPTYPSDQEVTVTEVIEVNAGYCKRTGIKEGDTVKFEF
ncbi:MAG: DUF192 domain-containing protein [Candidatus Obscuribacterales bacterium]|nr:DUF192 domain-containing protein [Candidatus Obscuribacterales bacterium]